MPKKLFLRRIIERFMDEKEFSSFVNAYEEAKLRKGTRIFTTEDWKLFDTEKDINKLAKKWDISVESVYRRLGKMYIIKAK